MPESSEPNPEKPDAFIKMFVGGLGGASLGAVVGSLVGVEMISNANSKSEKLVAFATLLGSIGAGALTGAGAGKLLSRIGH